VKDPKNFVRVVAGIFYQKGRVLMGCRHPCEGGRFVGHWEFPGGRVEEGESAEEALAREFLEELNCPVEEMRFHRQLQWSYPDKEIELHYYFVRLACDKPETYQLAAHSKVDWFDPKTALELQILPANRQIIEDLLELGDEDPFQLIQRLP
jgi:8-oxo-dGTP diphosphatase